MAGNTDNENAKGNEEGDEKDNEKPSTEYKRAPSPLPAEDQFFVATLRRQVAVGFKHILGQCRLALKYSVIGWTGTLEKDKIQTALASAPSLGILNRRIDKLERALLRFLPPPGAANPMIEVINADTLARIEHVRERLLSIELGVKSIRHIVPVLEEIERDFLLARFLPPRHNSGWMWSWQYDDWFRWDALEKKWIGAFHGWRVDHLMEPEGELNSSRGPALASDGADMCG